MRAASRHSITESRANLPVGVQQGDRGAPSSSSGNAEKEENTGLPDDDRISKNCTADEQSGGGIRGLVVRGLPLVFLPQQVEALWEVVAAADAAAAVEEAAATADSARTEGASVEAPGTGGAIQMAVASSPTQAQTLRRQDTAGSRPPLLNASLESPTALAARPPSPSEQHASSQRKHVSAATGQRKHPVGQGKDGHTAGKPGKSANSGATASTSRTGAVAGSSNATGAAVAAPAGVSGPVAGSGSARGKVTSRSDVSAEAATGNSHLSPSMCVDMEREGSFKHNSDKSALLQQLICQHLSAAFGHSAEEPNARACAAVVELHVFNLLFAGTIGLCSEKTALYMSIIAAAVEDLSQEKTPLSLSPCQQSECLRKRIRRQTFDPFAKYTPGSDSGESSLPAETNGSRSSSAYPTFSRKEAQKLFQCATDTFAAHSRLYAYCMMYPRKQVTNVNLVYTYIPIAPPSCPVSADSLTMLENASEGSSAAPLVTDGSMTPQQERRRSAEAPVKHP